MNNQPTCLPQTTEDIGNLPAFGLLPYRLWLIGQLAAGFAANKDIPQGENGSLRVAAYAVTTADEVLGMIVQDKAEGRCPKVAPEPRPRPGPRRRSAS